MPKLAPQILTTLGILGTFTGIFVGLLGFDIEKPNSVPMLLDGLKIAFGTSIFGLGASLLFRLPYPFITNPSAKDVGAPEIVAELKTIVQSLTGDNENSISGELQKLRAQAIDIEKTSRDGFKEMADKLDQFSKAMSDAFSKALIEELNKVIRDFNEKLNEQFGENFKQLNEAVGRLVEWQENYKSQMTELKNSLDNSLAAIDGSQKSLANIEQSTQAVPQHLEKLPDIYERFEREFNSLHQALETFANIREKAQQAFPEIERNIKDITENFRKTGEEQAHIQQQMLDGLQRSVNETITKASTAMTESIGQLDKAIQDQIQGVVQTMAGNLSGITQQFVHDYTPLLEKNRLLIESMHPQDKQRP